MNRKDIIAAAQAYVDRYDEELASAVNSFLRVVESKINTALKVGEQSVRAQIYLEDNQEYYGLPDDFGGFRDVELIKKGSANLSVVGAKSGFGGQTLTYATPEHMNGLERRGHVNHKHYTVIANQIQISPPSNGDILEVVYYQTVPALQSDDDTNWLTEKHPDAHIFGLCAEMAAFAKDDISFQLYDARFKESLANITQDDQVTRWSGPHLRVELDGLIV